MKPLLKVLTLSFLLSACTTTTTGVGVNSGASPSNPSSDPAKNPLCNDEYVNSKTNYYHFPYGVSESENRNAIKEYTNSIAILQQAQRECGHRRWASKIKNYRENITNEKDSMRSSPSSPTGGADIGNILLGIGAAAAILSKKSGGSPSRGVPKSGSVPNCRPIDATCIKSDPKYQQCMALPRC